jgi:hypothetical protein
MSVVRSGSHFKFGSRTDPALSQPFPIFFRRAEIMYGSEGFHISFGQAMIINGHRLLAHRKAAFSSPFGDSCILRTVQSHQSRASANSSSYDENPQFGPA